VVPAALASIVGLVVAVGLPVGWSIADHPTAMPAIQPGTVTSLAAPTSATTTAAPEVSPSIPVSAPRDNEVPPTPARPVRITIGSLSIAAPVVAEGVDSHGEMAIPTDIQTIGWYQWSAAPSSSTGSIVLVGHVDSATQGLGAFFHLSQITSGSTVQITTTDGRLWKYRVIAREEFPKTAIPLPAIFAQSGPSRLVLATCGGRFDEQTKSYYDNIVITAIPISATSALSR
jgi:Sortase domain